MSRYLFQFALDNSNHQETKKKIRVGEYSS